MCCVLAAKNDCMNEWIDEWLHQRMDRNMEWICGLADGWIIQVNNLTSFNTQSKVQKKKLFIESFRIRWQNKSSTHGRWVKWMNEWCFRPRFCTCKTILGWGQPGLMGWISLWIMPWCSINRSTCWPAVQCATTVPWMPSPPLRIITYRDSHMHIMRQGHLVFGMDGTCWGPVENYHAWTSHLRFNSFR